MSDLEHAITVQDGTIFEQEFSFRREHKGRYARVERRAVVEPLPGSGDALTLRRAWHEVTAIRDAHLKARALAAPMSAKDARRLGSCRPAFVHVWPIRNACDDDVCPFCWSRRVADQWLAVEASLFDESEARKVRQPRFPFDLLQVERILKPKDLEFYVPDGESLPDLGRIFADRFADRKKAVRGPVPSRVVEMNTLRPKYLAALDRLHVEPIWAPSRGWQVSIRQLFVVEPGAKLKLAGSKQWHYKTPDREQVSRAVAWLNRYPRRFLIDETRPWVDGLAAGGQYADPAAAIGYLAARKGRKLSASYGLLRKLPAVKPAAELPVEASAAAELPVVEPVSQPEAIAQSTLLEVAKSRAPVFEDRAARDVLRRLDASDRARAVGKVARDRAGMPRISFPLLHEVLDAELGLPVVFRASRLAFDFDGIFVQLMNGFADTPMWSAYQDAMASMGPDEGRPLVLVFSWPRLEGCEQMAVLHAIQGMRPRRDGTRIRRQVGDTVYTIEPLPSFLAGLSLSEDGSAVIEAA
jgi:hypothetical protein